MKNRKMAAKKEAKLKKALDAYQHNAKKPVRPLKPKLPAKVTVDDGSEGSDSGSDDE